MNKKEILIVALIGLFPHISHASDTLQQPSDTSTAEQAALNNEETTQTNINNGSVPADVRQILYELKENLDELTEAVKKVWQ